MAEVLEAALSLDVLVPSNVIVIDPDDGTVVVPPVDAEPLVGVTDNSAIDSIAAEVLDQFDSGLEAVARVVRRPTKVSSVAFHRPVASPRP